MTAERVLARVLATWFGCGYWPFGPGTLGALAAVLIAAALVHFAAWTPLGIAMLGVAITLPGIWASRVEGETCGNEDPGHVVIDEVAGQWITFAGAATFNWKICLAAFLLFRLFDIWKPPPVRQLERLGSGAGVMADDLMAGIYGAAVLALLGWFTI
jgi:phosphatidylglycerophosphatase A